MPDLKRPSPAHRVLVVDRKESLPAAVGKAFSALPSSRFDVVGSLELAYKKLSLAAYDALLLSESVPDNLRETLLSPLKHVAPEVPVIIVTDQAVDRFELVAKDSATRIVVSRDFLGSPVFANVLPQLLMANARETGQQPCAPAASALRDPLTQLFCHRTFHEQLDLLLDNIQSQKLPLACILLDIDYFRQLNETLGHSFGDEVLRQTAAMLAENLLPQHVACRYGGEKFGVILPETAVGTAVQVAEKIRQAVAGHSYIDDDRSTHITVSAGVAGTDHRTRSKNQLIQHTETALAEAKSKGRNRVCFWQDAERRDAMMPPADQAAIDDLRERFAELQKEFKESYLKSSLPILEEMEAADGYLKDHSRNVARLSTRLAHRLHLDRREVGRINTAALLHDIGKLAIGGDILRKATPLSEAEFELIKKHPLYGVSILSQTRMFDEELPLILHHHERYDGEGYPHGLKGEQIPLGARIICLAEAFDGLTAGAVYRAAISTENAIAELARCAGSHFDPELVTILIHLVGRDNRSDDHMEA